MSDQAKPSKVHIIGGGTVFHVRPHLALSAPAYGATARRLADMCRNRQPLSDVELHLTRMAQSGHGGLETNDDVKGLLASIVADPRTKVIFLPVALTDFKGSMLDDERLMPTSSGKGEARLESRKGVRMMAITPAEKLIGEVRRSRKDIFLIGFKTTAGASEDDQYLAGLRLLKTASCNLVLANDLHTRTSMVVTPEQSRYFASKDRESVLGSLVEMVEARASLTFTRSTVLPGEVVPWVSDLVPGSLRRVVDHCVAGGAYKPFLGSTVGHFAVNLGGGRFLTSIRKSDFNRLNEHGLVLCEADGDDSVSVRGARPSVGGQSQRIIFREHPDADCIVHFHAPLKDGAPDAVPVREQWRYECGSHECGRNTSSGLKRYGNLYAVMLDKHGPNIVFNRSTDPGEVISFIERNFDLAGRTDGLPRGYGVQAPAKVEEARA